MSNDNLEGDALKAEIDRANALTRIAERVIASGGAEHKRQHKNLTKEANTMKCSKCPWNPPRSEAGDYPDCPGTGKETTWKDGEDGCTLTRRQLEKMDEEYSDYLGDMGDDMGIQMDFDNKGWKLEKALDDMRHMIGLDMFKHKPYRRHGKLFYKPYRNYWAGFNKYLDYFSGTLGLAEKLEPEASGKMPYYYLTRRGLDFLGRHIKVTIHNVRD